MTAKLLLVKSENGLETRQDYDGLSSANPAFTGTLTGGSAALTGGVDAGGEFKSDALAGAGTRPVVALADGTIDDQDAATFRTTIGALAATDPVFTGALKQGETTRITAGGDAWFASLQATNLVGSGDRPIAADFTGTIQPKTPTQFRNMISALSAALKGAANGVAELGADGKVPSAQLPSYVDDVLEYATFSAFPATGETGKIYISQDDNKTWRWSGSAYVEISASLALGETSATAYRGDRGKIAYDHSQATGNPHGTTAADVGALPSIMLTGAVDFNSINGGAPCVAQLSGSSYTNGPPGLDVASGGSLIQTIRSGGKEQQEFSSPTTGLAIRYRSSGSTWGAWDQIWDSSSLPAGGTGKSVLAAASQSAARSAIAAAASAGVTDGSNAGAGVVGQYFEALLPEASQVSPSNGVPISVLSLSLPAGDWLVEGRATAAITGAMAGNEVVSGLNTSVAIPTDGTEIYGGMQVFSATNGFQTMTGSKRFSLASTATVHLVGRISFSAGTPGLFGCMSARRMR